MIIPVSVLVVVMLIKKCIGKSVNTTHILCVAGNKIFWALEIIHVKNLTPKAVL